jgi:hypothetical protein
MSADDTDVTSDEFEALWANGEEAVLVPPPDAIPVRPADATVEVTGNRTLRARSAS